MIRLVRGGELLCLKFECQGKDSNGILHIMAMLCLAREGKNTMKKIIFVTTLSCWRAWGKAYERDPRCCNFSCRRGGKSYEGDYTSHNFVLQEREEIL